MKKKVGGYKVNGVTIHPGLGKVLVRRDDEQTEVGGILLPEASREVSQEGTVVAIGRGIKRKNKVVPFDAELKPGVRVLVSKWGGAPIDGGRDRCVLLDHDEVLAVIG